jgi:hypothetical protein
MPKECKTFDLKDTLRPAARLRDKIVIKQTGPDGANGCFKQLGPGLQAHLVLLQMVFRFTDNDEVPLDPLLQVHNGVLLFFSQDVLDIGMHHNDHVPFFLANHAFPLNVPEDLTANGLPGLQNAPPFTIGAWFSKQAVHTLPGSFPRHFDQTEIGHPENVCLGLILVEDLL